MKELRTMKERKEPDNVKDKALLTIEGLTFEDITMPPEKKLEIIYKFAHVGLGECKNSHKDWVKCLDEVYKVLKKHGVI